MKEKVLITGASGAIAKALYTKLKAKYEVCFLTRKKEAENEFEWDVENHIIDPAALDGVQHVIHLAGANISEKRWTDDRKKELISSRIDSAKLILNTLKNKGIMLKSFISASGINYYGTETSEKIYTEEDQPGKDFLSKVVILWENAADEFKEENLAERVVKVRTAIVLSPSDGALPKMSVPVKLGIGSPIGSGKQYMPWIHLEDICEIYVWILENADIEGSFNASAPEHTDNAAFTRAMSRILKKPFWAPNVPSFILKLIFGELANALLQGSRASSEKIQKAGFKFKFPDLKTALEDLL